MKLCAVSIWQSVRRRTLRDALQMPISAKAAEEGEPARVQEAFRFGA